MQLLTTDYNGADVLCAGRFKAEWTEVEKVLTAMPTHLKASDQAGKQGELIFDPKGTNEFITGNLLAAGWSKARVPPAWAFFGVDVDSSKRGVIVEAQFSNYPFLINNVFRTELFVKHSVCLGPDPTQLLVVVTKARIFPASNSTLYYEQGKAQLDALVAAQLLSIPIRLVGLTVPYGNSPATFTDYKAARYSRTVGTRLTINCDVKKGAGADSRSCIVKLDAPSPPTAGPAS